MPCEESPCKHCGSTKMARSVDEIKNAYRNVVLLACADCGKILNPEEARAAGWDPEPDYDDYDIDHTSTSNY